MSTYVIHPTGEQETLVKAFLKALDISFINDGELEIDETPLPQHVIEGIAKSKADFKAGRTVNLEDFKRRFLSAK